MATNKKLVSVLMLVMLISSFCPMAILAEEKTDEMSEGVVTLFVDAGTIPCDDDDDEEEDYIPSSERYQIV